MESTLLPSSCPTCSAPASGRFCSNCGSSLGGNSCAGCSAPLSVGARFCHRCGTVADPKAAAVSQPGTSRGALDALPWAVAAIALVALIAMVAGQRFANPRGNVLDAPMNALPQAGLDFPEGAVMRAPPLVGTPSEIATRLYDRIMMLNTEGKVDSARFLAINMAIPAHQMLDAPTLDDRYHFGRIGEIVGATELARAQADTILAEHPTHLLGLALAASAARLEGDVAAANAMDQRLLAAESGERGQWREEYESHRPDIEDALARARQAGG
jgi:hypothetical protein